MHRILTAALFLLLPAIAFAAQPQNPHKAAGNSCEARSVHLLQALRKGDFTAATSHFNDKMRAAATPQNLEKLWKDALPQEFGVFEKAGNPITKHVGTATDILTPLQFAHGQQAMVVSCNAEHKIQGLFFDPGMIPSNTKAKAPASTTAWITKAAVGAKTLPITVQRNGFALKGVLDLPAGKGPFDVVDIIPGSGPVDINGNDGPLQFNMYKQLPAALVKDGWAVARVAKRGMPPSSGDGNDMVFEDQVADNLAIVKALRKDPHINPKRIVVAGHSIGGLIAPKLATETRLAGLILLEAPDENMAKIVAFQA